MTALIDRIAEDLHSLHGIPLEKARDCADTALRLADAGRSAGRAGNDPEAGMSHTPGPWQVNGVRGKIVTGSRKYVYHGVGPDGEEIAAVWFDERSGLGWKDARLIAASPEMLTFVEMVASGYITAKDQARARALLARIRGEAG